MDMGRVGTVEVEIPISDGRIIDIFFWINVVIYKFGISYLTGVGDLFWGF
jgi:hypothetical protein